LVQDSVKRRFLLFRSLVAACKRYARSLGKNCVRVLTGRKTLFNEDGLFLRQYVLHLTGIRPIRKITCTGLPGEGAGSQALTIMNTIALARASGLTYAHTPFSQINHADRPMEEWVAAWESVFNLGAGEAACGTKRSDAVDSCYHFLDLMRCFGWSDRRDELCRRFADLVPEFKRKYYLNKSPRTTDEVTVAVHVRRGDVSADRNSWRFTNTETILRTITTLKLILDALKIKYAICIYSQGNSADFAEVALPGVELFLDVDPIWTMKELVEADILVVAKSSFSYYAALISDGIIVFEPWDDSFTRTESWIACPGDGSLDRAAFERQLFLILQAKAKATPTSKETI
jgi:hypothetical protein